HAYMRMLYKYPQRAFPYRELVFGNRERGRLELEYELLDTGVFDENRYFDVFIEYAKETPEEILIRITAENRATEPARLHLVPQLWFRNTWWRDPHMARPVLERLVDSDAGGELIAAHHRELGTRYLCCAGTPELLFTDNETNTELLLGTPNASPFVKDGINEYLVNGKVAAVDSTGNRGMKAAAHYDLTIPASGSSTIQLRLGAHAQGAFGRFDAIFGARRRETDEFYAILMPHGDTQSKLVMRQAFAGLLWSKQTYHYDVRAWLSDRGGAAQRP